MRALVLALSLLACQQPAANRPAPTPPPSLAAVKPQAVAAPISPSDVKMRERADFLAKVDAERRRLLGVPARGAPNSLPNLLARIDTELEAVIAKNDAAGYSGNNHRDFEIFKCRGRRCGVSPRNIITSEDIQSYCSTATVLNAKTLEDASLRGKPVRVAGRIAKRDHLRGNRGMGVELMFLKTGPSPPTLVAGSLDLDHDEFLTVGSAVEVLGLLADPVEGDTARKSSLAGWAVIAPGSCEKVAKLYAKR